MNRGVATGVAVGAVAAVAAWGLTTAVTPLRALSGWAFVATAVAAFSLVRVLRADYAPPAERDAAAGLTVAQRDEVHAALWTEHVPVDAQVRAAAQTAALALRERPGWSRTERALRPLFGVLLAAEVAPQPVGGGPR